MTWYLPTRLFQDPFKGSVVLITIDIPFSSDSKDFLHLIPVDSICNGGTWLCTNDTCGATCSATGDPHFITLDKMMYDFMGICTYYLLSAEDYTVVADTEACGRDRAVRASCTRSVLAEIGQTRVSLKQDMVVEVNGKHVRELPFHNNDALVYRASSTTIKVEAYSEHSPSQNPI